ncbi:MAG: RluA family pseudouridine synthase [Planctomycetota bacterium]
MPSAPSPGILALAVPASLAGERLDAALVALAPELSRSRIQKLVRRGLVRVDGRRIRRSSVRVQPGQHLGIDLGPPEPPAIEILYEDEDVVAVAKPAGIVAHPTAKIRGPTVCELVAARCGRLSAVPGRDRAGIVHRLDRETSGVMILARSDRAARSLRAQFRTRRIRKLYLAVVHGAPAWERTVLRQTIGPHPDHDDRQVVDPPAGGREAITAVEVRERFARAARLECRPRTGRRHQIRVQLHAAGHPLVGDELYLPAAGAADLDPATFLLWRQALHARELVVEHPADGRELRLIAPSPPDLERLLAALRAAPPRDSAPRTTMGRSHPPPPGDPA